MRAVEFEGFDPNGKADAAYGVRLPSISVIIVNYNYGMFIGEAIDSLRAQTHSAFECILVDNGSDDDSVAIAQARIVGDRRFQIHRLKENLGHIGGGLFGLQRAKNEFIVFLDADDVIFPSFLATHLQVHLASHRSVGLTSSNLIEIDEAGAPIMGSIQFRTRECDPGDGGLRPIAVAPRLTSLTDGEYAHVSTRAHYATRWVAGWLWGPGTSNMYRRSMLELFAFDLDGKPCFGGVDCHFNQVLHALTGSVLIDMPLSARRLHGRNDYARMPDLANIGNGNTKAEDDATLVRLKVLETLMERSAQLQDVIKRADLFFGVFDHVPMRTGRDLRKFYARLVPAIAAHLGGLAELFGEGRVLRELRPRLGSRLLYRVVAQAPDTTARRWLRLFKIELLLRLRKWRKSLI